MKVLTFGEILLRLTSPQYTKLLQKNILETSFCGSEANVAVSLSIFGLESEFITALPANDIGDAAINTLKYFSVNTSNIKALEGRMPTYYLEKGASQRPSKVIYDRKYSSFSLSKTVDYDWKEIFNGIDWFHFSGINPALSESLYEVCLEAVKIAKSKNITVSCDLNYRKTLWSRMKAKDKMKELMPFVDVCIGNEEDAETMLGIKPENTSVESGVINKNDYKNIASDIAKKFGCKYIAFTLRESISASLNGWSAILYETVSKECVSSEKYSIQLVDRVGGGDSFSAGLIYGLINKFGLQETIEFATAASCLKQCTEGDFNRSTVKDVYNLVNGSGNGRVIR